jgi:hypothetical protein
MTTTGYSAGCKARLQEYEGILEIPHKREVSYLKNVPLKPQCHTGMVATETWANGCCGICSEKSIASLTVPVQVLYPMTAADAWLNSNSG